MNNFVLISLMILCAHSTKLLKTQTRQNKCNYNQDCCASYGSWRDGCWNDWSCVWNISNRRCQRASLTQNECSNWGKNWVYFNFLFQEQCSFDPGCTFNGPEPHGTCVLGCNLKNYGNESAIRECCFSIDQNWSCYNRGNFGNCNWTIRNVCSDSVGPRK